MSQENLNQITNEVEEVAPAADVADAVVEPQLNPPVALDAHVLSAFRKWAGSNVAQFIHSYFTKRRHYKHIFRNRQPNSRFHTLYSSTVAAPFTTPTNCSIVFGCWQSDDDPEKFNAYHQAKLIFTELDILLKEDLLENKDLIVIMDLALFTRKHAAKITNFAAYVVSTIAKSAMPVDMGPIYIINAPDWVSDYTDLYQSFDFHIIETIEDLQGFVPLELLPSDMGGLGAAPPRDHFVQVFAERLGRYACWLNEQEAIWDRDLLVYSTDSTTSKSDKKKSSKKKKKKVSGKNSKKAKKH